VSAKERLTCPKDLSKVVQAFIIVNLRIGAGQLLHVQ